MTEGRPGGRSVVLQVLQEKGEATPEQIARHFQRVRQTSFQPLLESLTLLGQARLLESGQFAA